MEFHDFTSVFYWITGNQKNLVFCHIFEDFASNCQFEFNKSGHTQNHKIFIHHSPIQIKKCPLNHKLKFTGPKIIKSIMEIKF